MADIRLTELQEAILEIEALGLPPRDAMRLVTQRVGYFVGQARYVQELDKAQRLLASAPHLAAEYDLSERREASGPPRLTRAATHQIGSTGG